MTRIMKTNVKRKLSLYDVARAVEEERVAIALQPILRARDHRFPMFHEGLIRIFDGDGDLREANEFMGFIEGTEIGNYVDQVALELVIKRLSEDPAIRLSVNMSTHTMWDSDWMYLLKNTGTFNKQITERLIVEFTETSVMQSIEQTKAFMAFCRQFGVCFACDDFGAGQTVLGHLRELDFDILKVDGSICTNVATDKDSQVLLKAVQSVATHFDMITVAEMIETPEAAEKCKEIGIDGLQGFLFGRGELFNPSYPDLVKRALSAPESAVNA